MSETASTMLPLESKAPFFALKDVRDDKLVSLPQEQEYAATVIIFMCNHCPYVLHILDELLETIKHYQNKNINILAINSNDTERYPADSPANMKKLAQDRQFSFPYLFDEDQSVAKLYQAACTPDFYVFDKNLLCVYRGRFDGATPGNQVEVSGEDLRSALDNILANKPINTAQHPSLGCNIKWK
jgi:peroxiredoxin